MVEQELEERVKKALVGGKLPCAAALNIAQGLKIPPKHVGDAANELNIKLAKCQLGCFE